MNLKTEFASELEDLVDRWLDAGVSPKNIIEVLHHEASSDLDARLKELRLIDNLGTSNRP